LLQVLVAVTGGLGGGGGGEGGGLGLDGGGEGGCLRLQRLAVTDWEAPGIETAITTLSEVQRISGQHITTQATQHT